MSAIARSPFALLFGVGREGGGQFQTKGHERLTFPQSHVMKRHETLKRQTVIRMVMLPVKLGPRPLVRRTYENLT